MTMATDNDVLEYMPDLYDYGIQDFNEYHEKTRQDIFRLLRIRWWPTQRLDRFDIKVLNNNVEMDETLLTETQFTRSAVFHVLAYYILPQLSKFEADGDRFREMMDYFKSRFEEEFDYVLRDGVEYDLNDDGTITDSEKAPQQFLRLVR
jgi:hypothetical protein